MESARPATAADVAEVAALYRVAVPEAADKRGGEALLSIQHRDDPEAHFASRVDADDALVVVGTIDDVIVGFASAERRQGVSGPPAAVIEELFTLVDARGVGVGEAMIEEIATWARQRGCGRLDSQALPGDRNTKNFFETFGLVARAITVSARLDQD